MSDYDRLTDMQQGQLDEHEKALSDPQREGSETAETAEFKLRAMAHNYRNGHLWDHLDSAACNQAADEISGLKAKLTAAREALESLCEMYKDAREQDNVCHEDAYQIFWKGEWDRWDKAVEILTQLNEHE